MKKFYKKEKKFAKSFKEDVKKNKNEENKEILILLSKKYIIWKITLFNDSEKEIKNRFKDTAKLNFKDINELLKFVKILKEDE